MHAHQFWWVWYLWFRSYGFFLHAFKNSQNFPSDHGPWSQKNVIDRNQLKKFMQIRSDVTCMRTNFGGRGLSCFGVMASFFLPLKTAKISLRTMDYSPWSSKNLIDRNRLNKFMQIGIDVTCMRTNFGWRGLSSFGVMASFCLPSKTAKISLRTMDYSP